MGKVVITGNGYTTQTNEDLNRLLSVGLNITAGLEENIIKYVEDADEVIEGSARVTLQPETEYYVGGGFWWECTEDYIEKKLANNH